MTGLEELIYHLEKCKKTHIVDSVKMTPNIEMTLTEIKGGDEIKFEFILKRKQDESNN